MLSSLCRAAWDEQRIKAYAATLLSVPDVPIERIAQTARHLLTQIDPDDITPARLIAEAKRYVPPGLALLEPPDADDVVLGYGQATSPRVHPGQGQSTLPVALPNRAERRRMNAQYRRASAHTADVLAKQRAERERRSPNRAGDIALSAIGGMLKRWLKQPRYCDWCAERLTEQTLAPYLDWCRNLGQIRPVGTPMPEPKVFCDDCAPGAISELVDGIRYVPERVPF